MATHARAKHLSIWDPSIVQRAIRDAFRKLHPRTMARNPVMFVVEIGSVLTTWRLIHDALLGRPGLGFEFQITFWLWLRRGASSGIAVLCIVSLIGFAVALTRVDAAFAGRAYAAYGGIYIAASLVWLWLVEGQQPTATDMLGASIAIIGALVIIGLAVRPQ